MFWNLSKYIKNNNKINRKALCPASIVDDEGRERMGSYIRRVPPWFFNCPN